MKIRDVIGGLAATAIGAGYLAMAATIRTSALSDAVGPAGLPKVLGAAMLGLGLILTAKGLLAGRTAAVPGSPEAEDEAEGPDAGPPHAAPATALLRVAGLVAIGAAYLLVVRTIGYAPAIALLIAATALHGGVRPGMRLVAIAVAGAAAYYVLFVLVLGIPLPAGRLFQIF